MEGIGNFISMMDYILDTNRKRHITGGILLSASLLFGGLALTVMTIQNEEDDEDKKDESEEPVVEKTADSRTVDKPSIAEYAARLQKEGYVNYSDMQDKKTEEEIAVDRPYVIQPSEFGEFDDYEKISLTYTADGVLLDDMNEIVDDIEEIVGEDSLEHFGEYEDDSVYVRNDSKKCDYEILLDQRNYQEIFEIQPHRTEM